MTDEALIGRTVAGKYAVERLVGQGAMGCVYRCRQLSLGTTLALKVLHRQLAGEPMFAARFLREAQAASRVDHPNSMRVLDFGEEPDGLLYIAMEYVDGKTLAKIIEDDSPLPLSRIVDIVSQALAALAVAHDIGVIHRDLKPENIMVLEGQDDEGRLHDIVKVCDFGVAKLLQGGARGPSVTAEGLVVGTPEYMSPEQARGEVLDARSDIYAMGVLLFHLMTGKVPFDSSTAFGTALMQVNDEPTRPRVLNPRVDSRLEKICLKAMRKRPEDRHASARELRSELRALVGHKDEDDMNKMDPSKVERGVVMPGSLLAQIEARPRRSGLLASGFVVAAMIAAGAYLYPRPGASSVSSGPVQTASITSGVLSKPAIAIPPPEPPAPIVGTSAAEPTATAPRAHAASKASARRTKVRGGVMAPIAIGEDVPLLPGPEGDAKAEGKAKVDAKADAEAKAKAKADADARAKADADRGRANGDGKASAKRAGAPGAKVVQGAKADPADVPLPTFPIPSVETPVNVAPPPAQE